MGDVIAGRFELLDVLARGGTGSVWRARDHKFQVLCAAKVLRQRDSAGLLRFVREQSITSDHPQLLTPYGWAAEDATVVIAMPLAAGGTVAEALNDFGAFSPDLAATVLDQVLSGLAELHSAGWVHRDIKPANLMFREPTTARPRVQVADFGLALHRNDVRFTHTGMVHGTTGFMAPEVLAGGPIDPVQDVFAAGISTIQLLFPGDPLPEAGTSLDAPALQAGFIELLGDMIATDPAQRPTAGVAQQRLRAIAGLLDGPFLTADGEPFEVFDQLQPLITDTSPQPDTPSARGPSRPPGSMSQVSEEQTDPQARQRTPAVQEGAGRTRMLPSQAAPLGALGSELDELDPPGPDGGNTGSTRRRRRGFTTAVMSLIALLAGIALILSSVLPQSQQVPADQTPSPGQPAQERTSEDDAGPDPTGDEDEPQGPVDPNQECSWVEENTTRSAEDGGTLTCVRQDDGSYAWQ